MESVAFRCLGFGPGLTFRSISILNGLGEVLLDDSVFLGQVRNRSRDFKEPVEYSGAEVHAGHDEFHEILALLVERHQLADLFGRHLGIHPVTPKTGVLQLMRVVRLRLRRGDRNDRPQIRPCLPLSRRSRSGCGLRRYSHTSGSPASVKLAIRANVTGKSSAMAAARRLGSTRS